MQKMYYLDFEHNELLQVLNRCMGRVGGKLLLLIVLVFSVSETKPQSSFLIAPQEAADRSGNDFADPLFSVVFGRTQQVYGLSEFSNASADLISIDGISFRLNEEASSLDAVIPNLRLQMGTYMGSMLDITRETSWDSILMNPTTVFSRQNLRVQGTPNGNPNNFQIKLTLDNPYVYDRNLGHLVLRIYSDGTQTGAQALDFERTDRERGLYQFFFPLAGPAALPGALVTQFSYTPVPEPSAYILFATGILLFRYYRGRKTI